jgi:hypothetical protein
MKRTRHTIVSSAFPHCQLLDARHYFVDCFISSLTYFKMRVADLGGESLPQRAEVSSLSPQRGEGRGENAPTVVALCPLEPERAGAPDLPPRAGTRRHASISTRAHPAPPSPLNGERAGVRGVITETRRLVHGEGWASAGRVGLPDGSAVAPVPPLTLQSLSPLRGEGGRPPRVRKTGALRKLVAPRRIRHQAGLLHTRFIRERVCEMHRLARMLHTQNAGSGDPAYRHRGLAPVGRVSSRGALSAIQSEREISRLGRAISSVLVTFAPIVSNSSTAL